MSDLQAVPSLEPSTSTPGTLGLVAQAAQRGATRTRQLLAGTWTVTERLVGQVVYATCYNISFGIGFPTVLLARSIPVNNVAVRGLIEGARAASQKVDELYNSALATSTEHGSTALTPA